MSNGIDKSLGLSDNYDKKSIAELMSKSNSIPIGFEGDSTDYFYDLARTKYPDLNLPSLKDTLNIDEYPADSTEIDLSPEKVNTFWSSMNNVVDGIREKWDNTKDETITGYKPPSITEGLKDLRLYPFQAPKRKGEAHFIEGLVNPDSWMYLDNNKPLRDAIMVGINQSASGMMYNTAQGKDLYDIDEEKYDPDFMEMVAQNTVAMSDPVGLIGFFGGYGIGGRAHVIGKRALQKLPKIFQSWWSKATGRHIVRKIPNSKSANSIKSKIIKTINSEGFERFVFGAGGMGIGSAVVAAIHSNAEQRMNRGKYINNNGTINFWDTTQDMWKAYKHGVTTGAVMSGITTPMSVLNMGASARWQMGEKNLKTLLTKVFTSKPARFGVEATTFTALPMALDEDVKASYFDEDGNFDSTRFGANLISNGLFIAGMWGVQSYSQPKFRTTYRYHDTPYEPPKLLGKGSSVPSQYSFPKLLIGIKKSIVPDIKYENNKLIDAEVDPEIKMLNAHIKNIKENLGKDTPFEFFEKDITRQTEQIETVDGLKTIRSIVDKTIKIQEKAGIKNDRGEYIDVDIGKLSADDINHLIYVMPNAVTAYQGYRLKYYETEGGKEEYIKRYEAEQNGGKKLSEKEKKQVLFAFENRIKKFDVIKNELNKTVMQGLNRQEQINLENKSDLDEPTQDVVVVDKDGNAVTGEVLRMNANIAQKGINEGSLITAENANKKNIEIAEVESSSVGIIGTEAQKTLQESLDKMLQISLDKALKKRDPYAPYTRVTNQEIDDIIEYLKTKNPNIAIDSNDNIIGDNPLIQKAKKVNKVSSVEDITNILDVYALDKSLTQGDIEKYMPFVNKLFKHSGKERLLNITKSDVDNFLKDLVKDRHEAGRQPVVRTAETTALRRVFKALMDEGVIKSNPASESILKKSTEDLNEFLASLVRELPEPKVWFKVSSKLANIVKNADKKTKAAVTLFDNYPIRDEEINALRGGHIKVHPKTGAYYIDLLTSIGKKDLDGLPGAAKKKGVKRALYIPKEFGMELQQMAGGKPQKLLFPGMSAKITAALQRVFPNYPGIRAASYKRQLVDFAGTDKVGLSKEQEEIFRYMSGHSKTGQKIVDLYKNQKNWSELFEIQKIVLQKIAGARISETEGPQGKTIAKFVKRIAEPGLRIEIIKDKDPKEVISIVKKASKTHQAELSKEVKKKLVNSINSVWSELTKDMEASEKRELMNFYAKGATIENYEDFGTVDGNVSIKSSPDELVLFSDSIIDSKIMKAKDRKDIARRISNVNQAKVILENNNIGIDGQKELVRDIMGLPLDTPLSEIDAINLNLEQSKNYLSYVKNHPDFKQLDRFDYLHGGLESESLSKLSRQIGTLKGDVALQFGLHGQIEAAFSYFAKKLNAPELNRIAKDLRDHGVIESKQGGLRNTFENRVYELISKDHIKRGINTAIRMWAQPTSILRRGKRVYTYGKKIFDRDIKNNLVALVPERYNNLVEHVKNNPTDKVAAKRLKGWEKFHNKVYKIGEDGKVKLRKNTLESQIAGEWNKTMKNGIVEIIELSLKANMTEASWTSYQKKGLLKWIKDNFYVPRTVTDKFLEEFDINNKNIDRKIDKAAGLHAIKLAQEKYNKTNVTNKEVKEFEARGMIEAVKDLVAERSYGGARFVPRHLLRRKVYYGERIKDGKGRWIDVYETEYENYFPNYIASQAKLIANLEKFPYLVNIPGLKFNASYPKILADIIMKGGVVGEYIGAMIASRTGLHPASSSQDHPAIRLLGRKMQGLNKYLSRANLTTIKSPVKNLLLALNRNSLRYDLPQVLHNHVRALSFRNRQEAKETGMMGVSYVAITENDNNFVSNLFEKMFITLRFPSSEEMGRTSSIYNASMELPYLVDGLKANDPKWLRRAKFYRLSDIKDAEGDSDIALLKTWGLGDAEVDWEGITSAPKLGIGARFKMVDGSEMTVFERQKTQRKLDIIHAKILSMAHERTQGSIRDIDQPWILQQPVIKGAALYSQIANSDVYNTFDAFREIRDNGNWHRFAFSSFFRVAGWFTTIAFGAAVMNWVQTLLKGMPDPKEIERSFWTKWARKFHDMEIFGTHSWLWGVMAGVDPMSNPYLPNPALQQSGYAVEFIKDIIKIVAEATGTGQSGSFARYFVKKKSFEQAGNDFLNAVSGAYRDWRLVVLNAKNPYRKKQIAIDKQEKSFYKHAKPLSRPDIVVYTTKSDEYRDIKESFEMTKNNFAIFNQDVINAWWAAYNEAIQFKGESPVGAKKIATISVKQKLASLNPILNGIGNNKGTKYFSLRTEYLLYLKNLAVLNKEDKNPFTAQDKANIILWSIGKGEVSKEIKDKLYGSIYVKRALEQELVYNLKIKAWEKQFPYYVRDNYKKEEHKKEIQKIRSTNWDKLGLLP